MWWSTVLSVSCLLFVGVNSLTIDATDCFLPDSLKREIQSYQGFVNQIIDQATQGKYSGRFYDDLAAFVDKFGNRLSGTKNLEDSISHLAKKLAADGLQVQLESVKVPYWTRGNESAQLICPRQKKLSMLGLGYSPGTNQSGITAEVVVVTNFEELVKKGKKVEGKIVLFNNVYTTYGESVKYRVNGPAKAAKLGAVAALIRSVTPFSINSPHTGTTKFSPQDKKIPAAAITLEDADMMARLTKAGIKVVVNLKMGAKLQPNQVSNNLIADIPGGSLPNHYVTVSGHIDSWDVGSGALDDGVGAFLAQHSLLLLKSIKAPKPKRTIRAILWTAEELGLIGAKAYLEKHTDQIKNWTAALESDSGLYKPLGLTFDGNKDAMCILKEIAFLFQNLKATQVEKSEWVGSDISVFKPYGVPLAEPLSGENNYMWFHHTEGDSMRTMNSTDLDQNLALFAGTSYILANLSIQLPRGGQTFNDFSTAQLT